MMATPKKNAESKPPEDDKAAAAPEAVEATDERTPDEVAAELRQQEAEEGVQPPVEPGRTPNPTEDE